MNTFAIILLAFPLYLAINGKLTTYIDMAKSGSTAASNVGGATGSF
jgi:hypothetical protein